MVYKGSSSRSKVKKFVIFRVAVFFILFLLVESNLAPFTSSQSATQNSFRYSNIIDGQILFAPMNGLITYLIDRSGAVNHTWPSSYIPGEAVIWLGDGTILRTIKAGGVIPGGAGGGVQKIGWDGTILWDFRYNTDGKLSHHDVKILPNGNVLLIAWETKTRDEAIAAGRNPNHIQGNTLLPDHVIEVKPTGPTSGDIVWEWHVWDHLIQDYDPLKANYGVVGDHPELVDINYASDTGIDWMHTNSIDYNKQFDQLLLSVNYFNEIWVIDHSTTTAEAASHTGGTSGKGGDILYRWGNPEAYRAGTSSDRKLFLQHDASWILPGYPGAGDILIFNNGLGRPGVPYSSIDEITPPVNSTGAYNLTAGSAYGPSELTWTYVANPPGSFYSGHLSGAQRLADGNTLICSGEPGKFFEVTPSGSTVWEYTNEYPTPPTNNVFKIAFVPPPVPPEVPDLECIGSFSWTRITPGAIVNGSFQLHNVGNKGSQLNWTVNTSSITWGTWTYSPETGKNLTPEDGFVTVRVSVKAPDEANTRFEGYIRVENQNDPNDFELIPVSLKTPTNTKSSLIKTMFIQFLLQHFPMIHGIIFLIIVLKNHGFY